VSDVWVTVVAVGAATVLFKAAGPLFLGRRPLPPRVQAVAELLAPVMLTALVVNLTFGGDETLTVDARVPGVVAGAVAVWRRVPLIGAMVIGAVVTAVFRQLG
jgi:branched-subunit amino acid transport protein